MLHCLPSPRFTSRFFSLPLLMGQCCLHWLLQYFVSCYIGIWWMAFPKYFSLGKRLFLFLKLRLDLWFAKSLQRIVWVMCEMETKEYMEQSPRVAMKIYEPRHKIHLPALCCDYWWLFYLPAKTIYSSSGNWKVEFFKGWHGAMPFGLSFLRSYKLSRVDISKHLDGKPCSWRNVGIQ